MELDVSDEAGLQAKLFSVPEEIWLKIFCHIDPLDVLALARSCRFFSKFCDIIFYSRETTVKRKSSPIPH